MRSGLLSVFLLIAMSSSLALAQADPTSTFLLNYGAPAPEEAGLESGRYKSRPQAQEPLPLRPVLRAPEAPKPAPAVTQKKEDSAQVEKPEQPHQETVDLDLMNPTSRMPEGRMLDFELGTALQYNSSSSPSWFRRYSTPGLAVQFQGSVWLTGDWALSGYYGQSMAERVSDSYTSVVFVGQSHREMALGFSSKLTSGPTSEGELGVYYYERRRSTERTARMQADWVTQGALLRVKYSWKKTPSSVTGGYFDFQIYPAAHHRDSLAGGVGLGRHHETYGGKIRVGRSAYLSDNNRIFWGVGGQVEQNRFTGVARVVEPEGYHATGVYGIHSTVFFEFGLGWSQ